MIIIREKKKAFEREKFYESISLLIIRYYDIIKMNQFLCYLRTSGTVLNFRKAHEINTSLKQKSEPPYTTIFYAFLITIIEI